MALSGWICHAAHDTRRDPDESPPVSAARGPLGRLLRSVAGRTSLRAPHPGAVGCLTPLGCVSQPTQCETLRSGQGDAAPPLNPQLPAPLPGQRAVGAAVANRVAGALPEDHLTVMAAARTPPTRSRRPTMARRRTWTAPARAIERERSRLGQAPSGATGHGSHDGRSGPDTGCRRCRGTAPATPRTATGRRSG